MLVLTIKPQKEDLEAFILEL